MHEFWRIQELLVDVAHKVAGHPLVMGFVFLVIEHEVGKDLQSRIHFATPVVSNAKSRSWYSALTPVS